MQVVCVHTGLDAADWHVLRNDLGGEVVALLEPSLAHKHFFVPELIEHVEQPQVLFVEALDLPPHLEEGSCEAFFARGEL